MEKIKIEYISIDSLKISEYNPRKWDSNTVDQMVKSIKSYDMVDPLIVNSAPNRYGVLIGGHLRLHVLKKLKRDTAPVVFLNIPEIEREKKLNLTLNRVSGDWDYELLKNFDIEMLLDSGFDDLDLSHIFDDSLEVDDDNFNVDAEVAKIKTPQTKFGDLIQLGQHRLFCGDSTDPQTIKKLVGEDKVQMLNFDPIYNIGLSYHKGISTKGKYGGKVTDKKSDTEYREFLRVVLQNGLKHAQLDCHVFCWCDETYIGLLQSLYTELGISNKRVCLWIKNNFNMTPQIAFNKVYEPCVYGTIGSPYLSSLVHNLNEVMNKEIGTGNRLADDIMDLFNIWLVKRVSAQDYEHPTQKPPSLYEKSFRRCTKPGEIILDLFAGSGSQLVAAEQLKRRAFLCEIDPVFCDVIVARFKSLTGKEVEYVNSEK